MTMAKRKLDCLFPTDPDWMPVEAYIGGNGDLILCQETTTPDGERYLCIGVRPNQVRPLCEAMLAAIDADQTKTAHEGSV
jgi:hypothetical protein